MEAYSEYLVTFCGTGVKPKPRLSDITSAAALKDVTPSGTVIFPLVHVLSLIGMTEKKDLIHLVGFCPKYGYVVNCAHIFEKTESPSYYQLMYLSALT